MAGNNECASLPATQELEEDGGEGDEEEDEDVEGEDVEGYTDDAQSLSKEFDERLTWRKNATYLYDLFVNCSFEWPHLSVAWLADEPSEGCRLVVGTQTDDSAMNQVMVMELTCQVDSKLNVNEPWRKWNVDGFESIEGFGCSTIDGAPGPLRCVAQWDHPTEVNRVAPCPHRSELIATKTATGGVLLFDYKAEREAGEKITAKATLLAPDAAADGFALTWSRVQKNILATGGNDGRLCLWDIEVAQRSAHSAKSPLHNHKAHDGALCDLSFSSSEPSLLASVGDADRQLRIWDARVGMIPQLTAVVSKDEVLAVDWSYTQEFFIATAGRGQFAHVWDTRSMSAPLKSLWGHEKEAVTVRWAPFCENLLASCSEDGRLILWDLQPRELEPQDGEADPEAAPELLFAHAGHSAGVSDFAWNDRDSYLICSVASDNCLQLWQPSTVFYMSDSDAEIADPPRTKKPRLETSSQEG